MLDGSETGTVISPPSPETNPDPAHLATSSLDTAASACLVMQGIGGGEDIIGASTCGAAAQLNGDERQEEVGGNGW